MSPLVSVRACVLCGVVGAPLVALDVPFLPPPFFSVIPLPLCAYGSCVVSVGSAVLVPFSFPLSLIVMVWCLLSLGSRFLAPVELEDPPPCNCKCREVGVCGVQSGPVPVVLAKVLATPLVSCLGSVVCSVVLFFLCLATPCVSFLPGPSAFPFALSFSRLLRPLGRGRAPCDCEGADADAQTVSTPPHTRIATHCAGYMLV